MNDVVTYSLEGQGPGAIALIGINRPDKRNAISEAVIQGLRDALLRAHDEADVGVLFGHGNNFSAGLDLAEALKRATGETPQLA
jgi:(methylthio)acryloyl-CoA hydratase